MRIGDIMKEEMHMPQATIMYIRRRKNENTNEERHIPNETRMYIWRRSDDGTQEETQMPYEAISHKGRMPRDTIRYIGG